jgi:hypothetical protein
MFTFDFIINKICEMTDLQVMLTIQGLYVVVLGFVALTGIQHGKKLAVLEKMFDMMNTKLDLFVKTETDVLKDMLTKR